MNRLALPAVIGLAGVLVATFVLHYQSPRPEDAALPPSPIVSSAGSGGPTSKVTTNVQALVDTILTRPLFNPGRRPAAITASGAPGALPRLSAVLVSSHGKSVIFAGEANGKPLILAEGSRIGVYTVQSIGYGQVTMLGPSGLQVIRPAPDGAPGNPARAGVAQPSMLDLLNQGTPMLRLTPLAANPQASR